MPDPKRDFCDAFIAASPQEKRLAVARFMEHVDKTRGLGPQGTCWEWRRRLNTSGYGMCKFLTRQARPAHRIAFAIEHGDVPNPPLFVLHHCDNRRCVNPEHLYAGTDKDNARDRVVRFTDPRFRLTAEQVHEILALTQSRPRPTHEEIAELYGVCVSTVSHIATGREWSLVSGHDWKPAPQKGENHWRATLTAEEVRLLRELFAVNPRLNCVALAAAFSVGVYAIQDVRGGRSWRHLLPERSAA
jgi:hypothetical protein